jgi:hypothetical protein
MDAQYLTGKFVVTKADDDNSDPDNRFALQWSNDRLNVTQQFQYGDIIRFDQDDQCNPAFLLAIGAIAPYVEPSAPCSQKVEAEEEEPDGSDAR